MWVTLQAFVGPGDCWGRKAGEGERKWANEVGIDDAEFSCWM